MPHFTMVQIPYSHLIEVKVLSWHVPAEAEVYLENPQSQMVSL